jgi:hypothetical protein
MRARICRDGATADSLFGRNPADNAKASGTPSPRRDSKPSGSSWKAMHPVRACRVKHHRRYELAEDQQPHACKASVIMTFPGRIEADFLPLGRTRVRLIIIGGALFLLLIASLIGSETAGGSSGVVGCADRTARSV